MAFQPSRTRIAGMVAKVETTYGSEPSPAPSVTADGFLSIMSPNPVGFDQRRFEFRPHGSTFTRAQDILGARLSPANFQFLFAGPGATTGVITPPSDPAAVGFLGMAAVLRACGLSYNYTAGNSVVFAPNTVSAIAGLTNMSATIWANLDGWIKKVNGFIGNAVFSGTPESSVNTRVTGLGKYNDPVAVSTTFDTWTGGSNRAKPNLGITLTITPAGGSAYTPVAFSYEFDLGVQIDRIPDMNNAAGIWGILLSDKNPMCRLTIAMDRSAATVTYANFYTQLAASTTHSITWTVGSGVGLRVAFLASTAQLVNITDNETANVRGTTLEYKLQSDTAQGEYSITVT